MYYCAKIDYKNCAKILLLEVVYSKNNFSNFKLTTKNINKYLRQYMSGSCFRS